MNDDDLLAYRRFDRPHRLDPAARERIGERMVAALDAPTAEGEPANDTIDLRTDGESSTRRGRWRHFGAAALAVAAAVAIGVVLIRSEDPPPPAAISTEEEPPPVEEPPSVEDPAVADRFCAAYLDPLAATLDIERVNPTAEHRAATEAALRRALDQLPELVTELTEAGSTTARETLSGRGTGAADRDTALADLVEGLELLPEFDSCRLDQFAPSIPVEGEVGNP